MKAGGIDAYFSPSLAGMVLDAFRGAARLPVEPELDQLTGREREVLSRWAAARRLI